MKLSTTIAVLGILTVAVSTGCSAITDFDGVPESEELYSIKNNLVVPVEIVLTEGDTIGTLTMHFRSALPEHTGGDDEFVAFLSSIIAVEIENPDGITFALSDGEFVVTKPDEPTEWNIMLGNDDRTEVDITFYNGIEGYRMEEGDVYRAHIDIADNDYFVAESLTSLANVVSDGSGGGDIDTDTDTETIAEEDTGTGEETDQPEDTGSGTGEEATDDGDAGTEDETDFPDDTASDTGGDTGTGVAPEDTGTGVAPEDTGTGIAPEDTESGSGVETDIPEDTGSGSGVDSDIPEDTGSGSGVETDIPEDTGSGSDIDSDTLDDTSGDTDSDSDTAADDTGTGEGSNDTGTGTAENDTGTGVIVDAGPDAN